MSSGITVGGRALEVVDAVQGAQVPTWVLYPSRGAEQLERFGPYALPLAVGAAADGEQLPVVLISHGRGSSPWTFRGLAAHLARAGFVVALPEHPGNSRSDNSLDGTPANLLNRPRHVRLVLDAVYADEGLRGRLSTSGAGVIGHSIGAYTALASAGGEPSTMPHESPDGVAHRIPTERDPRVGALVLLTPAAPWLMGDGALASITASTLLLAGERDEFTPHEQYIEPLLRGLRGCARLTSRVVPGAGHFSFQSPFPPALTRPDFPPSQDPPGFDRAAFQPELYAEIEAFLRGSLAPVRAATDAGRPS